jgi:hypothetical protein
MAATVIPIDTTHNNEKPWLYCYGANLAAAADSLLQFEFLSGLGAKLRNAPLALKTLFGDYGR